MKLTAEHFPISCSLETLVEETFGSGSKGDLAQEMPLEELLGYLRKPVDLDLTPYADLLSQTEEIGDPSLPSPRETAILRWVGEAMHHFEQRFPLEEPLASQVRRLKPLAAAIAIVDRDFLQPDVHPLHQLLDTIQERAVGWQSRLGRAGTVLEQQVATAVDGALEWFDNDKTDLSAVCAEFLAAAERDQSRAERMARRVVETEMGKVKTAGAKRDAAEMINTCLANAPTTTEIGEFLKGAWYDSAQLVLLKFGRDSEQWAKMSETTATLLDSVQSLEGAGDERRQHVFELVTQLPKEMRRWLLSLHHDTDAVNDAMGIVEFAHLRILRGQEVELDTVAPISVADDSGAKGRPELVKALSPLVEGHWFGVETHKDGAIRARLVLKEENEQRLLFTNLAGMKVIDNSFEEFDQLLEKKRVTALPTGGGFSLCLAIAAGLDTTEKLEALYRELAGDKAAPVAGEDPQDAEESTLELAPDEPSEDPGAELQRLLESEKSKLAARQAGDGESAAPGSPEPEPAADPADPLGGAGELLSDEELQHLEGLIGNDGPDGSRGAASTAETTPAPAGEPAGTADEAPEPEEETPVESAPSHLYQGEMLVEEVSAEEFAEFSDSAGKQAPPPEPEPDEPDEPDEAGMDALFEEESKEEVPPSYFQTRSTPPEPVHDEPPAASPAAGKNLDLPMGTWLGFHDGDTPMMAKLAVHDPDGDTYIFVNRNGIKLREMGGEELGDLIARGLVDVLQTSSTFREEVDEARKKLDS